MHPLKLLDYPVEGFPQTAFQRGLQFLINRLPHLFELGRALLPDRIEPALNRGPQAVLGFFHLLGQADQRAGDVVQPFLLDVTGLGEGIGNPGAEPVKFAAELVPQNLGSVGLLADAVVELLLDQGPQGLPVASDLIRAISSLSLTEIAAARSSMAFAPPSSRSPNPRT